ncbi:MAG TPA: BREX system ATP-binding domain-containing protein [Candidatus Dormibacteraeota bacterium]|nr:BREX system ATP-binding domain-containing protein [Candidatus Dormibacteraeota bacterium]
MSTLEIGADAWVDSLRGEYLDTFVREGGAAVKVAVVPSMDASAGLARRLVLEARERAFAAASVDAASCKAHLLHNLFHEIARQVDWEALTGDFVRRLLLGAGLALPAGGELDVASVAATSDLDVTIVRQDVRLALTKHLTRDRALSRQFRLAALALCQALLEPDELRVELAAHVRLWLRGELPRVSSLRQAFIHQKIDRHSARTMILSTAAFVRHAGLAGLVVTVDVSRYALGRPLDDGRNRYSKAAAMDMWETLRQFIDGTDDVSGCLFVFLVGREFVEDDARGVRGYPAVHMRLADDVRDRRRPNPLAPMVRIAESGTC